MMMSTPIWTPSVSTDLADAFNRHLALFRGQRAYVPGGVELGWLNALRDRALRRREQALIDSTDKLLALLANPSAYPSFKLEFEATFDAAWRSAYPLSAIFLEERRVHSGITMDYTLTATRKVHPLNRRRPRSNIPGSRRLDVRDPSTASEGSLAFGCNAHARLRSAN
jgi:hypothetical protein